MGLGIVNRMRDEMEETETYVAAQKVKIGLRQWWSSRSKRLVL